MYQLPQISCDEILIYLRKSRTDNPSMTVEEVLAKHEKMLDEWTEKHFEDTVPLANRFREIVSGETISDRPKVQQLLKLIESPRYKAVLVVEPQRLSRGDLEDAGRIIKLLRYSNTVVLTLQYNYDLSDEMDRENFSRELKRGNEFLEYQKRIMMRGRIASVENGNYIGSIAPYGYDKVEYKNDKRTFTTLTPNKDAENVKLIFDLYLKGNGATKICDALDSMGIVPNKGNKWSPATIYGILSNPHYIGKVVWDRRKSVKTILRGNLVSSRPRAMDYNTYEGKHPAIISDELYESAQKRLGTAPRTPHNKSPYNPFAGILYCQCGSKMCARTYSAAGKERCNPRVLCYNQRNCQTPSVLLSELNTAMVQALSASMRDIQLSIKNGKAVSGNDSMLKRLTDRVSELEEKELKQWDEFIAGNMPEHIFRQLNSKTTSEKEKLLESLKAEKLKAPPTVKKLEQISVTLHKAIKSLQNSAASVEEKNELLKSCVERIEYSRKRENTGHNITSPFNLEVILRL